LKHFLDSRPPAEDVKDDFYDSDATITTTTSATTDTTTYFDHGE